MTASTPKGPTVHLAANVSVGVMFLSNLSVK
jgi:intracellular multiplication protein IcmE